MRITDLGQLKGPVLAFGGPYSNLSALQAMRDVADGLGIAPSHVICTGDVVAYCAEAAQTVALMQDWGVAVVAGNCELQLAAHALDCGCGFDDGSACDLLSAGWYAHANASCDAAARAWMGQCPDIVTFEHAGRRCAVIHGGLSDVARFLWSVSADAEFAEELHEINALCGAVDVVIAGHSGIPFARRIGSVDWINAGVIGMPPHDGGPQTRYALLHADGQADICRLSYDPAPTIAEMRNAGLLQGYHTALQTGWWPSEDVLPLNLRKPVQSLAIG